MGIEPVPPGTGAALRLLAAAGAAKAVVEIGTGTGTSGLWLLQGMRADGILTTIDVESEYQRMAKRIFAEAGYQPSRTRIITGRALDVLPRLADGVYDLLFVDGDPAEYPATVTAAARLLRPGGVLVINGALAGGQRRRPGRPGSAVRAAPRGDQGDARRGGVDLRPAATRRRTPHRRASLTLVRSQALLSAPSPVGLPPQSKGRRACSLTASSQRRRVRTPQPVAPLARSPSAESAQAGADMSRCAQRSCSGPVNSRR